MPRPYLQTPKVAWWPTYNAIGDWRHAGWDVTRQHWVGSHYGRMSVGMVAQWDMKAFKSQKSSKQWTMALVKCLMLMAWDMWQQCNEALHKSEWNQQEIVEGDINQQIWQVYDQDQCYLLWEDQQLMNWPLPHLLKLPAPYKCQWLATLVAVWHKVQIQMARNGRLQGLVMPTDGSGPKRCQ